MPEQTHDPKTLHDSRECWRNFLDKVQEVRGELDEAKTDFFEPWYRGHVNASYELTPQLFRGYPDPNAKTQKRLIQEQEQDLYWEFASRARELHGVIDEDWDILFAMQHYGVPTRLLDWTENLYVAVYFAIHSFAQQPGVPLDPDSQPQPCLWVLNPYELNTESGARDLYDPKNLGWDDEAEEYWTYSEMIVEPDDGIDWEFPLAVYPRQRTNRMHAQRGWFTIHGTDFSPLKPNESYLRRIDLTGCLLAAREALDHAGISLFTMFPELPSLALHLKRQHDDERRDFLVNREAPRRNARRPRR